MAIQLEIVAPLFDSIDATLQSTLVSGTARVISGLGMLYGAFWVLQITAKSLAWYWRGLNVAIEEIVWSTIKMAAIAACAFNVGWYISTVTPFVNGFPEWVSSQLSTESEEQANLVDSTISTYLNLVIDYCKEMKFNPFTEDLDKVLMAIVGLIFIILGGVPFLSVAVATLITLKIATTLILVLGPLFIAFLLYDQTRQWFWGWVSALGGFMLTQILFASILALEIGYIKTSVLPSGVEPVGWSKIMAILLVFNGFTVLATALPNLAASIMGGGGIPTTSAGGLMGRTLGAATGVGAAKKLAAFFAASRLLRNRIS
jgi:type IV secretion system protein VirB6